MLIKLRLAKCGQKIKDRDTPTLKERERETKVKFQIEKIVAQKKQTKDKEREEMGNTESGQGSALTQSKVAEKAKRRN